MSDLLAQRIAARNELDDAVKRYVALRKLLEVAGDQTTQNAIGVELRRTWACVMHAQAAEVSICRYARQIQGGNNG